jgi:DNA-binding beta-propeller fold protein YncE
MKSALALTLALVSLAAGQDHPQAPTPNQLQTLVEWPRLMARNIAFTPDAIWVTRCDAEICGVTRIEAGSNKIVTTIKTSQSPSGIAAGAAGVWAAIPRENSVVRIDPATNQIVATIPTGKWPTDVAAGEGGIWVANGEGCWGCSFGTISRIDPATNEVMKTIKTWKYGTEVSPSDLLVYGGDVWAIAGEHVLRIDPEANKIVKWIRVPNRRLFSMPEGLGPSKLHGLAVIGRSLWVADSGQQLLWRIEMDTNRVIREPLRVGFPLRILGQREEEPASLWIDNQREGSTLQVKP